jgi:ABC-type nitrate/sulfonate/bicarbonate transport system substrate-binding protein
MRSVPAVLVAVILLVGCGGAAQAPASGASPTQPPTLAPQAPTRLRIAYSANTIDQVPTWVAFEAGYFQKNGLDVDLQYVGGGTQTLAALVAGDSQVSIQGGNEAMSAVAGGADVMVIANPLPVYAFKLEAIQGIDSMADLRGKKLAVSTIGGTADVALRTLLRKHGVDPDNDVTIVATGNPTTTQGALTSGAVQAALSVPPNLLIAEASGAHPIADLASERIPSAQNSVTVPRTWLNANRPIAQKLVDSLVQGLARTKADRAFTQEVIKKYVKYDDQSGLDWTYDFFVNEVWPTYPHVTPDQLTDGLTELSRSNASLKTFDPSSMLDDSLVQDAEKREVARQT